MLLPLLLAAAAPGCLGNAATAGLAEGGPSSAGATVGGTFSGGSEQLESLALHRLNAAEYDNTVRDLLGTSSTPATAFESDQAQNGFDNQAAALTLTVSRLQDYQTAAESLATELTTSTDGRLAKLAPCPSGTAPAACVQSFVTSFGQRAWRRPLGTDEVAGVVAVATGTSGDTYAQQVARATITLLMSPYFLYRVESSGGDSVNAYELATRLSYFLWSSTPDDKLLAAAADGSLLDDDVLTGQTNRMLADPRARALLQNFSGQWLLLRQTAKLLADPNLFPGWSSQVRDAAIGQTEATFADLMAGKIPFHALFDGNQTYLNDALANYYGMATPNSATLVAVPGGKRSSVLTHAAVLAATSYPNRDSIVHRGVFLMDQMLCMPPPAAPANVPPLANASANQVTQRQILESHAINSACAVCHDAIDPYGFALENYDAVGAFRTTDNGGAVDTKTKLADGTVVNNADDLSAYLAKSTQVPACFAQQLTTYAMGRSLANADVDDVVALQTQFLGNGQRADELVRAIVTSPIFRRR